MMDQIKVGGGTLKMTTLAENILRASTKDGSMILTGDAGNTARIITTD